LEHPLCVDDDDDDDDDDELALCDVAGKLGKGGKVAVDAVIAGRQRSTILSRLKSLVNHPN